ncbi:MAG: tetratricopeptide repeat protein [Cyanobacteria bacterium P01_F01_bin.150]
MQELDQVAAALKQQNYSQAVKLIKPLMKQYPDDPQVQWYVGNIHEGMGHLEKAEAVYRKLLQKSSNPKLMRMARKGLERLKVSKSERRQAAIARVSSDPSQEGEGFLFIAPIMGEQKKEAAQSFATIMNIDPYTANMQLPSRTWKLYRTGAMAELSVYKTELQGTRINAFALAMRQLKKIQVFQVNYIQSIGSVVKIVCQNSDGQLGEMTFKRTEANQSVSGLLPIFEDVVDVGPYNKLKRKEQTQDYAQVYDIHLPARNCILRLCDRLYQFNKGLDVGVLDHPELPQVFATTRLKWNALTETLGEYISPTAVWTDFTSFGPTALDHLDLMDGFTAEINLFRKTESKWDQAFQLFSVAALWHSINE